MARGELFWDLLIEHLKIDAEKLESQKEKICEALRSDFSDEISKDLSIEQLMALNEKIENEKYGKRNFLEKISKLDDGSFEVRLISYQCPFQQIAAKNPRVCKIHEMHYRGFGELCGWDFKLKSFNPKKVDCIHLLNVKRIDE